MPLILTDFAPENFPRGLEFFLTPFAIKELHRKVRKDRKEKRGK